MELKGRTILTTRAKGQSRSLHTQLERLGARVLEIPTIEITEPDSWVAVDKAIANLVQYDWLIFTSSNAAERFLDRLHDPNGMPSIAVVGSQTEKKVKERGLTPVLVPEDFRAEGLLKAFPKNLSQKRILLPRAEIAREDLPETLRKRGAEVDIVTVYRTRQPSGGHRLLLQSLQNGKVDCITLTSGSTVDNLAAMLGVDDLSNSLKDIAVAVIGPVTRESAEKFGLHADIQPFKATIPDLVESIKCYFSNYDKEKGYY